MTDEEKNGILEEIKKEVEPSQPEADEQENSDDLYSKEEREKLVEDDEMSPEEDGFMQGEEEEIGNCSNCNSPINEKTKAVNKDIHDNTLWFCSKDCLKDFED